MRPGRKPRFSRALFPDLSPGRWRCAPMCGDFTVTVTARDRRWSVIPLAAWDPQTGGIAPFLCLPDEVHFHGHHESEPRSAAAAVVSACRAYGPAGEAILEQHFSKTAREVVLPRTKLFCHGEKARVSTNHEGATDAPRRLPSWSQARNCAPAMRAKGRARYADFASQKRKLPRRADAKVRWF
jgi:hypothetical protein